MIVVLCGGGLGNQMFQYALGRSISIKNYQPLKLDISRYDFSIKPDTYKDQRTFGLGNFNISGEYAFEDDIKMFDVYRKNSTFKQKFLNLKNKILPNNYYKAPYVEEPKDHGQIFDPNLLDYKYTNAYFRGFWQSEKYFKEIADIIKKDFTVKSDPDNYNQELLKLIRSKKSVSLHFRRGNNTNPDNPFGLLNFDYYDRAVDIIFKKIGSPHFFIFSDDIDWVEKNYSIGMPATFVKNKLDKDYEDLRLMQNCRYHIIANSTFSWWGAWLADDPDKIVIAPEKYVQRKDVPNPDFYPDSWIKLK